PAGSKCCESEALRRPVPCAKSRCATAHLKAKKRSSLCEGRSLGRHVVGATVAMGRLRSACLDQPPKISGLQRPRWISRLKSTLACLEAALDLVDHVDAALAADEAVGAVPTAQRFQRVTDLHGRIPGF